MIMDVAFDIVFFLDKLDMIKGYGTSRRSKPYSSSEDLLWDFAAEDCEVGKILEVLDANRNTSKVH